MLRGTGTPEEENYVEAMMIEVKNAINEAERCRYGSICKVPKSSDFLMNVLPNLDEDRFKTFARVTKAEF
ncbi:unnamed protein product [Allacma fusca]|uniref:Uncharacterized protein n=1 Tax=Allacma fusca TaxID=39272 RepID=A0A8J2PPU2_9HEXA|nr:unnamed protein product [Allacma fusca]